MSQNPAVWTFADPQTWMAKVKEGFAPMMVTCAVNGGMQGREANDALPETPEQIASQAGQAYDAGAVAVHVHARDPDNLSGSATRAEDFAEVNALIRERCPDIIINNTTGAGPGVTEEERRTWIEAAPEMASLNLGPEMMRFRAAPRPAPLPHPHDGYFYDDTVPYTYGSIAVLAEKMRKLKIRPELETYHPGHLHVTRFLIEEGTLEAPYVHQFVMGYQTSSYPTADHLSALIRDLPEQSIYFVCGVGVYQLPMTTLAAVLGGHVRVGLEDNIYYSRGRKLRGNGEAVERAVRIGREVNREIATPKQARQMLALDPVPRSFALAGVAAA